MTAFSRSNTHIHSIHDFSFIQSSKLLNSFIHSLPFIQEFMTGAFSILHSQYSTIFRHYCSYSTSSAFYISSNRTSCNRSCFSSFITFLSTNKSWAGKILSSSSVTDFPFLLRSVCFCFYELQLIAIIDNVFLLIERRKTDTTLMQIFFRE